MSFRQVKNIDANLISSDYGIIINTQSISSTLIFTITMIEVVGTVANIHLTTSVNGIPTNNDVVYSFSYNKNVNDIYNQAEMYLITLDEFKGSDRI